MIKVGALFDYHIKKVTMKKKIIIIAIAVTLIVTGSYVYYQKQRADEKAYLFQQLDYYDRVMIPEHCHWLPGAMPATNNPMEKVQIDLSNSIYNLRDVFALSLNKNFGQHLEYVNDILKPDSLITNEYSIRHILVDQK